MPDMQPTIALAACEKALRQLLDAVMVPKNGQGWLEAYLGEEKANLLREKRATEQARRQNRGALGVSVNLVDYTEFYQLISIAEKHWSDVAPALGEKKDTLALLRRFDSLRNTVAHNRELLPFEIDLLSGIAGEIRNRVAIYMSDLDPDDKYYPRIERAVDSFGNEPDAYDAKSPLGVFVRCRNVLRPGDIVTFHCRGTDPQGRVLSWWIQRMPSVSSSGAFDVKQGSEIVLSWEVEESDVGNSCSILLVLLAEGAKYHRNQSYDQLLSFTYRVAPPLG